MILRRLKVSHCITKQVDLREYAQNENAFILNQQIPSHNGEEEG